MKAREFEEKAISFIRKTGMFDCCDRVLLACSGGADSVALVRLLDRLSGLFSLSLTVAHINHNLRDKASIADQIFVTRFCKSMGTPCVTLSVKISEFGGTLEERARRIRQSALEYLRKRVKAESIALGHNSGDRAETVLHNLARGSGLAGVSAMKPRNGRIVRPLLNTTRRELEEYLDELGQDYVQDESNDDLIFSRNRIRHRVIPELEKVFKGATRSISRFAQLASEDDEYLNIIAKQVFHACVKEINEGIEINTKELLSKNKAIIRRVIRMCMTDDTGTPTLSVVDTVIQRLSNKRIVEYQLGNLLFVQKKTTLLIRSLR